MDAQQTPFDIVPVPPLPFTPSTLLWIVAIGLILIPTLGLLLSARRRPAKGVKLKQISARKLQELIDSNDGLDTRQRASAAAQIVRRLLAAHCQLSVDSLTTEELIALAANSGAPLAADLLRLTAELDQIRYAPHQQSPQLSTIISGIIEVLNRSEPV